MPHRIPRATVAAVNARLPGVVLAMFALLVLLAVGGLWRVETIANDARELAGQNQRLVREGQQAHDVLCAMRAKFAREVANARQFLEENPDGIPGIPASLIARGIRDDDQTVDTIDAEIGTCPTEEDG